MHRMRSRLLMNFYTYIDRSQAEFEVTYLDTGLVTIQHHKEFPLDIYAYGREAVFGNVWDEVTSKCRGIIVHRHTGEVIARPFEKFHNYGSIHAANTFNPVVEADFKTQPAIWEKMDGFMCTLYTWDGVDYIASKGSFHSIHAKWATKWYRDNVGLRGTFPEGYTPVFEGLHPDLRIVVDYKERTELVLLALIHIETGAELTPPSLSTWAAINGVSTPKAFMKTWQEARLDNEHDAEGYVLTWYDPLGQKPPKRLKMKFVDYLRLHRMVCGVSPKAVWEALASNSNEIKEWLDKNNNTPWFEAFIGKWVTALQADYDRRYAGASKIYTDAATKLMWAPRKDYALEFAKAPKEFQSAAFKLLDNQDPSQVLWNQVKELTRNVAPCRDAQFS